MGWEKILKRRRGVHQAEKKLLDYIMSDGEFKTIDRILDDIYDFLAENRKMLPAKRQLMGRPIITQLYASKAQLKIHMNNSPYYESTDKGNKDHNYQPIKEYRYIGEWNYGLGKNYKA